MIIAVDFDGTCVTHDFPRVGKDIGAAPVLRELVKQGHQLILWTMRSNVADNTGFSDEAPEIHNGNFLDEAIAWFKKNEIPLYYVQTNPTQGTWTTSPKCYAHLYIDDAALGCPLSYEGVLSMRPFVDWMTVGLTLFELGILKSDEPSIQHPIFTEIANLFEQYELS